MYEDQRRNELAQFLRTRRERLLPSQVHLPERGRRRTPGLRREELANLAGVGLTWYTKLEQGQAIQVSSQVLESLAQALQLSPDERRHLFVLAREHLPLLKHTYVRQISPDLQCILDALLPNPAVIMNERWDIVGWNRNAAQVFVDYGQLSDWERNHVWLIFTHPALRTLYTNWESTARRALSLFRASAGHNGAGEPWFIERRDRLMETSSEFRAWWNLHEVSEGYSGRKELNHPLVGLLILKSTPLLVADNPNLRIFVYMALPEANSEQKLTRFALSLPKA
ncbi:transcriptional regulator [Reticulibacter mediterranei]|uniref:Transcriptional regulator n=1 Tax=Reticulibacter mediterranei TaxID=2778369 RepID=A0A8J3N764_9CHLR|nr:helix-turn-helix transcriptional regulator [Reticulibacter mediterranei]GHP01123.1 transcriptional regulator [Reticulibacter mediterranei]